MADPTDLAHTIVGLEHDGAKELLLPQRQRQHSDLFGSPVQERKVVPLNVAVAVGPGPRTQLARVRRIGHVEQSRFGAERPSVGVSVLADTEQESVTERMQIGRVTGDLQFARDGRILRIAQVEHVQRIHLAERHDIAGRSDEPYRIDALALAHVADGPHLGEDTVALTEDDDLGF